MKVMTILGTRPEIIRLCRVVDKLDALCEHVVVHTGQNYDYELDELFFEQLGVRRPDHYLGARGSFAEQLGAIIGKMEPLVAEQRPDRFLVLGDTNSSLSAVIVKRLGIPVFHMEAGNRCFDDRVPEEVNRRIIDHSSDVLLPYSERSRQNLLREGIAGERIFVTGNPINEVLQHYAAAIEASTALAQLELEPDGYLLVTAHRQENVDDRARLETLAHALSQLAQQHQRPVIVSVHPRTRKRLEQFGIDIQRDGVRFLKPFGFFDFVKLEKHAFCVLSDSGTVQEECALLGVPNVTLRDTTERPETQECGSGMLSGIDAAQIVSCVKVVRQLARDWMPPAEYTIPNVSDTVIKLVLGHLHGKSGRPR